MTFQTRVNDVLPVGVPGDFASANPRAVALATGAAVVAGAGGVTVGYFAWLDATDSVALNAGSGAPDGFVHNDHTGQIATLAQDGSLVIAQGFPVTVFVAGDFYVKNTGSGACTRGQKAFASLTTGQVQFAAAGATVAGYIETVFYCAAAGAAGDTVKISTWTSTGA